MQRASRSFSFISLFLSISFFSCTIIIFEFPLLQKRLKVKQLIYISSPLHDLITSNWPHFLSAAAYYHSPLLVINCPLESLGNPNLTTFKASTDELEMTKLINVHQNKDIISNGKNEYTFSINMWLFWVCPMFHFNCNFVTSSQHFPHITKSPVFVWSPCQPLITHLVQHNHRLPLSPADVKYLGLFGVQDGELQLRVLSQIGVGGGEAAHLHTWRCQLRDGERPGTCTRGEGEGDNQ